MLAERFNAILRIPARQEVLMADVAEATVSNDKTALTDSFRTHFAGDAPLSQKVKGFAKARPWTSAALVGVAAVALLNTFRGAQG